MPAILFARGTGAGRVALLAFIVSCLAPLTAARAQEQQLTLQPPLSQAFPLEATPGGVHVSCPVLVNAHTILRPDARLRFVYIDSAIGTRSHGDDGGRFKSLEGPHGTITKDPNTGGSTHGAGPATAWGANPDDDYSGLFDTKKDNPKYSKEELQKEVWTDRSLFADAFDHAAETGTTIVYSLPSRDRPETTMIDPPEGMLLGEIGGHIRVLAVEPDSRPYAAGIRAGDEIRSFGDGAPLVTLADFIRAYETTRHEAKISGNTGYTLNVWRDSAGVVVPVRIAPPPSIPSFL
jgi:hypothetical protein